MEKRIQLEKLGRPANQITELNLDNCRSTNIVGLTDEFSALETLSLINVGLTTLKGFPKLPNLKKLELSDNRISNGLSNLTTSPKLTHLNLSGNKIKDLEELKPLENFTSLQVLDLYNNEATSVDSYREKIFGMISSLKYLDGFDVNEVEALTDGEEDVEEEDELNGNDSDDSDAFCINGIEIDLKELELFEKQLSDKRKIKPKTDDDKLNDDKKDDEIDELDEYLTKLAIEIDAKRNCDETTKDVDKSNAVEVVETLPTASNVFAQPSTSTQANILSSSSSLSAFPLMIYGLMGILFFVSTFYRFSDEDDGDEDDDEELSLADVYNEDHDDEEDGEDYVEEAEDEDVDGEEEEDGDSDEDEANEANEPGQPQQPAEEESPARGKKRKHDG